MIRNRNAHVLRLSSFLWFGQDWANHRHPLCFFLAWYKILFTVLCSLFLKGKWFCWSWGIFSSKWPLAKRKTELSQVTRFYDVFMFRKQHKIFCLFTFWDVLGMFPPCRWNALQELTLCSSLRKKNANTPHGARQVIYLLFIHFFKIWKPFMSKILSIGSPNSYLHLQSGWQGCKFICFALSFVWTINWMMESGVEQTEAF